MAQERFAVALVLLASLDQTWAETLVAEGPSPTELRYGLTKEHVTTWANEDDFAAHQPLGSAGFANAAVKQLVANGVVDDYQKALLRSEEHQMAVQTELAMREDRSLSGHELSLRQMRECKGVNHKARNLVVRHAYHRMESGAQIPEVEKVLIGKLTLGSFGEEALDDLSDMISLIPLHFGIVKGVIWTVEDQQAFTQCNADRPNYRLEENAETRQGELLVQGDMVALGKHQAVQDWPDKTLTYCFAAGIAPRARSAFESAVAHIKAQIPCLRFNMVDLHPTDLLSCAVQSAVRVTSDEDGCWSHVGFVRMTANLKSQQLNLGLGCRMMGMAVHQLAHALGMVHQTSRTDRDNFVHIYRENVEMSNETFKVQFADNDGLFHGTTFDYFSIMNPPPFAFSTGGPTILTKGDVRFSEFLGQRVGLTQLDAERIGEVYGCDAVHPQTPSRFLVELLNRGEGYDDGACTDVEYTSFIENGKMATCMELAGANMCSTGQHKVRISEICRRACMHCLSGFDEMADEGRGRAAGGPPKAPPRSRRPVNWTEDHGYYSPLSTAFTRINAESPSSILELADVSSSSNEEVPIELADVSPNDEVPIELADVRSSSNEKVPRNYEASTTQA